MRFLVAESDERSAELLCQMLRDLGHGVCGIARTARQAVGLIQIAQPRALLVALDLAGALELARTAYRRSGIRTLFAGHADAALVRNLHAIQPYGFIAKPLLPGGSAEGTGQAV